LSKGWFNSNGQPRHLGSRKSGIDQLRDNLGTYFRYRVPTPSDEIMWTTFKPFSGALKGRGYAKGFVSHNAKATNEYRDRCTLAYALNRFLDPDVSTYFKEMGLEAREDLWSLSELVQWIFRSRVRDGQPINLYIPSERMRNILTAWLNNSDRSVVFGRAIDKEAA